MPGLDGRSVPHIMDLIYDYSDFETIQVLRQLCPEWHQRYASEFYHVRSFMAFRFLVPDGVQQYVFQTARQGFVRTRYQDWVEDCGVIDLHLQQNEVESIDLLRVQTLRVPEPKGFLSGNRWRMISLQQIAASRIVFDNSFRLKTTHDIPKLVINYRGTDFDHGLMSQSPTKPIKVFEVVFIAHLGQPPVTEQEALQAATVAQKAASFGEKMS